MNGPDQQSSRRRPAAHSRLALLVSVVRWRALPFGALAPLALIFAGLFASAAPAQRGWHKPPHPTTWLIEETAISLSTGKKLNPSPELLRSARAAIRTGLSEERAQAALVLGFAGLQEDRALLIELADDGEGRVREHAMLALGLLGGPASRLHHSPMLSGKKDQKGARKRALAAFALGLDEVTGDEENPEITLTMFAQSLLERNFDRHTGELAAAFFGFSEEGGRAVLWNFLESRRPPVRRVVGPPYFTPRRVGTARSVELTLLNGIATGMLARRVATLERLQTVLNRMNSTNRHPLERYRAAWGLYKGRGKHLSDKLKQKVVKALVRKRSHRSPEFTAMCFLALSRFDPEQALKRARMVTRNNRTRSILLSPSLVVLGRLGEEADKALLLKQAERRLSEENEAALCLALAELALRLSPTSWPLSKEAANKDDLPFPISELRARLDMADRLRPGLGQAAAAVGLARLGDPGSIEVIRRLYLAAGTDELKRSLALALIKLQPTALDDAARDDDLTKETLESMKWERLTALAYAGHALLWNELFKHFDASKFSSTERVQSFHLAAIALAGPGGSFRDRMRERLGPGALVHPLNEIEGW